MLHHASWARAANDDDADEKEDFSVKNNSGNLLASRSLTFYFNDIWKKYIINNLFLNVLN